MPADPHPHGLSTLAPAPQFKIIRTTVFLGWHGFPVVWVLSALGYLSIEAEHVGYIVCDLTAKYVLLFVYIASITP